MRIAVLAHSFPRFPGDTHGTFVKRLSEEICELGHEVHVLVPFDPQLREDPRSPLRVHCFRYIWPPSWHLLGYSRTLQRDVKVRPWAWLQAPLYFLFAPPALARLVRRERIDLVHAHWILPNGFVAWTVQSVTGIPFTVTLHGSDVFMAERNPLFAWMARKAVAGARHVTSCSADLRERLLRTARRPQDGDKISLVPNGTDIPPAPDAARLVALRRRLGLGADEPLVAAVGRLVDKKGFGYLIDAAPIILEAVPGARIVIGGAGDLQAKLEAQTRDLEVEDRVLFPGRLSHPEVIELLAAAQCFVMPSIRDARGNIDGLPVVVLEAMAAGKPVVATSVAGIPLAVRHGDTGLLVPEKDSAALAAAVVRLLADPETARRMGDAARERALRELTWASVARIHDEIYRSVLGQSPGAGEP